MSLPVVIIITKDEAGMKLQSSRLTKRSEVDRASAVLGVQVVKSCVMA